LRLPYVLILESPNCFRKTYSCLPITVRAVTFCILELIEPSPNQGNYPSISSVGTSIATYKAGQEAQVLDMMVVLQALCNQSPGSAWAHPSSGARDPTRVLGLGGQIRSSELGLSPPIRSTISQPVSPKERQKQHQKQGNTSGSSSRG
jgi:hypothetical protein